MAIINVSNISLILSKFLDDIKSSVGNKLNCVFDHNLTYSDSIRELRAKRSALELNESTTYPLLAFNRSALRRNAINQRLFRGRTDSDSSVNVNILDLFWGEFDFVFRYFVSNSLHIEEFEILYMLEKHINSIKEISVNLPVIGELKYFISWNNVLENIEWNMEDNIYISVDSTATINGRFMLLNDASREIIEEINLRVKDFNTEYLISERIITQ